MKTTLYLDGPFNGHKINGHADPTRVVNVTTASKHTSDKENMPAKIRRGVYRHESTAVIDGDNVMVFRWEGLP